MEHTPEKKQFAAAVPGARAVLPVTEVTGAAPGPSVLITAGIHGGEYPGIAASMELAALLRPEDVAGRVTIIHAANPCAFWGRRPELNEEDGKNLNRVFPGDRCGTSTERLAAFITETWVKGADYHVDCHSGDIHEDLCDHVYCPMACAEDVARRARDMARLAAVPYLVPSLAQGGAYNSSAALGVPAILIEHGGNGICDETSVAAFLGDLLRLLAFLGALPGRAVEPVPPPREVKKVVYVMAEEDVCWRSALRAGGPVVKGDVLGRETDLYGRERRLCRAEEDGVLLYVNTALALPKGKVAAAYAVL